jgi:hypothetical protein
MSETKKIPVNKKFFGYALIVPVVLIVILAILQFAAPSEYKPTSFLRNTFSLGATDYSTCKSQGGNVFGEFEHICRLDGKEFERDLTDEEKNKQINQNAYRNMSMTYLDNQIAPYETCNQEVGYDRCIWFKIKEEDRQKLPEPLEDYEDVLFSGILSRDKREVIQLDSLEKGSSATPDVPEDIELGPDGEPIEMIEGGDIPIDPAQDPELNPEEVEPENSTEENSQPTEE